MSGAVDRGAACRRDLPNSLDLTPVRAGAAEAAATGSGLPSFCSASWLGAAPGSGRAAAVAAAEDPEPPVALDSSLPKRERFAGWGAAYMQQQAH